jgi:hypothetical protein
MQLHEANYITPAYVKPKWQWSNQEAYIYDYLKFSNLNFMDKYYIYLHWNGSGSEYRSDVGNTATIRSICEASGNV